MGDARPVNRGLAGLLTRDDLLFGEAAHRRWLLTLPPFRPPSGHALHEVAETIAPTTSWQSGSVLLVGEHRGAGCLFWVDPDVAADEVIPFRGEARQQLDLVRRLVPRALPALVAPDALDSPTVGARRAVLEASDPGALDGSSFGLSLGLATASSLLEAPVPAAVIAMARLSTDGRCERVGRMYEKLEVVHRWALGVGRVLVAPAQEEEARSAVLQLGAELIIQPVADLSAALRDVFGDVEAALRERWAREPESADRAARALLSLARDGCHHLLDWSAVAHTARGLAHQLEDGEPRWMAQLAEHIANRHRDAPTPLDLQQEWLRAQPRPFRLKLWAHVVQSAADGMEDWRGLLDLARGELAAPGDEHTEDLALAAALGRAHASWYEYDLAVPLLERAADGWIALEAAHEMSYAVSELLRIAGASGNTSLRASTVERYVGALESAPQTSAAGRGFVRVALGRSAVQLGDRAEGFALLAALTLPESLPAHLHAARLRWLALASESDEQAAALRGELGSYRDGDGRLALELSHLDHAIDVGEIDAALRSARDQRLLGHEAERLTVYFGPAGDAELARLLARHSRY